MSFWFENEAIIESVHPLDASVGGEIVPDWIEDFCGYIDGASREVFAAIPNLTRFIDSDNYPDPSKVVDAISWPSVKGFVAKVQWRKRKYLVASADGGASWISSPGWTASQYVYAETMDELLAKAQEVVASDHEKEKAKVSEAP